MSAKPRGFPDLEALAKLDSRIDKLGSHYVTAQPVAAQPTAPQPDITHDAALRDSAQQAALPLPATTHSSRVRVTTYVTPAVAAEVRELIRVLDRPESWVAGMLLTEALAARAKG